ncbi:MAG: helix-turn-helix domain-containing protein [Myxococcales bacterium]|nr:helix-turn-helix domain-containing protein [Myxococcales bacterium]
MPEELLTTAEAARRLGIGPSTVKRWADEGILACVRTVGGHRRFVSEEVDRFQQKVFSKACSMEVDQWVDLLLGDDTGPFQINAALFQARGERSHWWEVCTLLSTVLEEIGIRSARGKLGIAQDHVASERLSRGLAFAIQCIGTAPRSPPCVLVTAEGEDHVLRLLMVELCAREADWNAIWLGRTCPLTDALDVVERRRARAVAMSASSTFKDRENLAQQERAIGNFLAPKKVPLLLDGNGAWPEVPHYGERIHTFQQLSRRLSQLRLPSRN